MSFADIVAAGALLLAMTSPQHDYTQVKNMPLGLPAAPAQTSIVGTVERVLDGDTLLLKTNEKLPVRVRLAWIDAPEMDQPGGLASTMMLSTLTAKVVEVRVRGIGRYGRVIGDVVTEKGVWVNLVMACMGFAWAAPAKYGTPGPVRKCEGYSRKARFGIWASRKKHIAPWEWRKKH